MKYLFLILLMICGLSYSHSQSFDKYELLCVSMVDDSWEKEMYYRVEYLEPIDMSKFYSEEFLAKNDYYKEKTSFLSFRDVNFSVDTYVNCDKLVIVTVFISDKDYVGVIMEAINPKYPDQFPNLLSQCTYSSTTKNDQ